MVDILNLIQTYYGQIISGGVSIGAIFKLGKNWFNTYVVTNMLILEKDNTLTSEQKFEKLTNNIYDGLPLVVRMFIGKQSFANLSQAIYDKIFPKKVETNTVPVDANAEIKTAIVNVISDVICNLDKNTDVKIQEMTKQIQQEKSEQLIKIADNLKQTFLANDDNNQILIEDNNQTA